MLLVTGDSPAVVTNSMSGSKSNKKAAGSLPPPVLLPAKPGSEVYHVADQEALASDVVVGVGAGRAGDQVHAVLLLVDPH